MKNFIENCLSHSCEKGESQKFFATDASKIILEKQLKIDGTTKFIDIYFPQTKVLVEQKSFGENLFDAFNQAKNMAENFVARIISIKKSFVLFGLLICVLLNFFMPFSIQAAEIIRETVPLERNNVALHLERYIERDGHTKKPILFVHGVTFSSHEFDVDYKDYSLARFFANRGFEVWLLDIAGFGSSDNVKDGFMPNSDYAAEDIEAAVRCILERNHIPSMDILGWSWGTVTGGRFAARHPEMVHRLVLYAPIVAGLGRQDVTEQFNHNTWESAVSDFQRKADGSIDFDIVEKAVASTYIDNAWHYDKDRSPNGGRRDLLVNEDVRLIPTANIKAPIMIIVGSEDPYVSLDLCREAYESLPDKKESEFVIVNGAAHAMMMERPYYRLFRERILKFLNKK